MSDSHQVLLKSYVELLNVLKHIRQIAYESTKENAPEALLKCTKIAEHYIARAEGKPRKKKAPAPRGFNLLP